MDFFRGLDVSCSTEATYIWITIFKILFILLLEDKKMISNCFDIIITPRYFPDLSSWIDNVLFCMVICFSGCKNVKMIPLVGLFIGYHIICYDWSLSFIGDLFKIFGFSINTSSVCCFYKCRNPYRQATCLSIHFWEWVLQSLGGQEKGFDAATRVEERVRRQDWKLYTERTFGLERDGCALIPDKETKWINFSSLL